MKHGVQFFDEDAADFSKTQIAESAWLPKLRRTSKKQTNDVPVLQTEIIKIKNFYLLPFS